MNLLLETVWYNVLLFYLTRAFRNKIINLLKKTFFFAEWKKILKQKERSSQRENFFCWMKKGNERKWKVHHVSNKNLRNVKNCQHIWHSRLRVLASFNVKFELLKGKDLVVVFINNMLVLDTNFWFVYSRIGSRW